MLARYGEAMPPLDYSPPPRGRDAVAIHLAQYLKAAAAPLGAGVLLLALGFARHRVPALAVICAAVLWGVALNERIALGHHLRQAADDEAPLPVRMAAVQHADATFFWGHRAGEGLRSLKETEVELPEDLRRVLAARGQARPAESENGVEP